MARERVITPTRRRAKPTGEDTRGLVVVRIARMFYDPKTRQRRYVKGNIVHSVAVDRARVSAVARAIERALFG